MAKAAKAKVSVDELVRSALLKVAEAPDSVKLTAKTDALFASAKGANADAIAELQNAEKPLLAVVGKEGKIDLVALAPAGFERIASEIPEENIGAIAKRVAQAIPADTRIEFIQNTLRRTPLTASELTPLLEEAVAAEKASQEARIAAAAKRKQSEETSRKALERAIQLLEDRRQSRISALRRELEAEGEQTEEMILPLRRIAQPTEPEQPQPKPQLRPQTTEEKDFRREVADQLAAAWRAAWDDKKEEPRDYLEAAMWNIGGLELVGKAGATIRFDGRLHECNTPVSTDESVRVVRPGWVLKEEDREYVVLKAVVETS